MKKVVRQVSVFINDKEVTNSLGGIGREIGKVRGQISNLNKDNATYNDDLARLQTRLQELTVKQSYFKDEIYGTDKALEQSTTTLTGVTKRMGDLQKQMELLDTTQENYNQELETAAKEYRELEAQAVKYRKTISDLTKVQTVNKNTLDGVEQELTRVKNEMRQLDRTAEEYREELARLKEEEEALLKVQAKFNEEIGDTDQAMSAAATTLSTVYTALASGNLAAATAAFKGLKTAVLTTGKALLSFLATPIGIAVTALAGIALATKEWFNYNQEVAKAEKITAGITKLSGTELDNARIRAGAIAKTYDKEFQEVLEVASTLVNEFKITYDEAFSQIEKGMAKGGEYSDEFLDSMREYPTFFNQAGFSVKEFQGIVNAGIDLSIYQDKLPDAIKEFGLAITEQTDATRDAMYNAFGTEFTDKLFKGVKDGSITVKDALYQISEEANRAGLNMQQQQQLTADLFKGAGEDAGGAIKIFEAVTKAIKDQNSSVSELEQSKHDLTRSEEELARAQDMFLKSDGFAVWENNWKTTWNNLKEEFYRAMAYLTNTKEEMEKMTIEETNRKSSSQYGNLMLEDFTKYLERRKQRLGDQYDFEKEREERLVELRAQLQKTTDKDQRESLQAGIDAIEKYYERSTRITNKNSIDEINARKKANEDKLKELRRHHDQMLKEEMARLDKWMAEEQQITDLVKSSLDERSLAGLTALERDIKQIENKYAAEIKKFKDHKSRLAELEAARDAEIQVAKEERIKEYAARIETINAETARAQEDAQLERDLQKATTDEEKERLQLEHQQALANEQLDAQEAAELKGIENVENAEELKLAIQEKYAYLRIGVEEKFHTQSDALRKKEREAERLAEIKKTEDKLNELQRLTDATVVLFGQSKAAASATALINGGLAVTEILKTESVLPEPLASISRFTQIAAVIATTGKSIAQINSAKAPKAVKFFKGGWTGTQTKYPDEYGGVAQVSEYHPNEWVGPAYMTQSPRYAATFDWLENERKNGPGSGGSAPGSAGGGGSAPAANTNQETNDLLTAVLYHLQNPVAPNLVVGYKAVEDLTTMQTEINQSSGFGKLNS